MIEIDTIEARCDGCYNLFTAWRHRPEEFCPTCRTMRALERIAEAIETWVGWQ